MCAQTCMYACAHIHNYKLKDPVLWEGRGMEQQLKHNAPITTTFQTWGSHPLLASIGTYIHVHMFFHQHTYMHIIKCLCFLLYVIILLLKGHTPPLTSLWSVKVVQLIGLVKTLKSTKNREQKFVSALNGDFPSGWGLLEWVCIRRLLCGSLACFHPCSQHLVPFSFFRKYFSKT